MNGIAPPDSFQGQAVKKLLDYIKDAEQNIRAGRDGSFCLTVYYSKGAFKTIEASSKHADLINK